MVMTTPEPRATGLRCFRCGTLAPLSLDAYLCAACAGRPAPKEAPRDSPAAGIAVDPADPGVQDVVYDYDAAAADFPAEGRVPGLWRWGALLPVQPGPLDLLPVGGTPIFPAPALAKRLGLRALYLKDDTRNPTQALKDRATALALTLASARGKEALFCASAGNAAISLAGFCAHAGLRCAVHVPSYASQVRLDWLRRFGAEVHVSKGDYDQAVEESEAEGERSGAYSRNCAYNPFLVEGKKTVAFEIGEQLRWLAPDLVVAPVGDGCTLGAIGKGFRELATLGRIKKAPRLVGVQARGVSPIVARFRGAPVPDDEGGSTRAASIAVRRPRNALRVLSEVRASEGALIDVSDADIEAASSRLAREAGVVVEYTAAAALAGLESLAEQESLAGKTAVLVLTGGRVD